MKTRLLILTILVPALLMGWGCFTGVRALIWPQDSRVPVNSSPAVAAAIAAPIEASLKSSRAAAQTPTESPAVDPLLSLRLVGVFMSAGPRDPIAIIQNLESKKVSSYQAGQELVHGCTLIRIDLREASLKRPDGSVGTLKLGEAASTPRKLVTEISPTERLVDRQAIRSQPLPVLLDLARVKVKPKIQEGRMLGFGVYGAGGGFLKDLGIEEGDVVAQINGKALENYHAATELFGEALQGVSFTATVIKKDKRLAMTYYFSS